MRIEPLAIADFSSYLNEHDQKQLLRLMTCGSVDDGKSTLIGRILYECQLIHDDQLAALTADSKKFNHGSTELDLALLVDGLMAEREQGITIDVAYRFFNSDKRKFIVADSPGHEQYTRNMATAASTAQAAIVLVDARAGVLTQTRRHSIIAHLFGIKSLILAINKMDLVNYDQTIYQTIKTDYHHFIQTLGVNDIQVIPLSALTGCNVLHHSAHMPWYQGPTLMEHLDNFSLEHSSQVQSFRMSVQWVNRPHQDFRGLTGRIASGTLKPGDQIQILPSRQTATVSRIVSYDGDRNEAVAQQSITITLNEQVDVSRGDVLTSFSHPCEVADQLQARLLWLSETAMVSGRQYLFKNHNKIALCTLSKAKYRIDVNTMTQLAVNQLTMNEIGECELFLDRPLAFEPYNNNKELGSFILIDRLTQATVAAGLIQAALRPENYLIEHPPLIEQAQRVAIKHHQPAVLWFTGLSGAGKSTLANLVEAKLNAQSKHTMLLDGDSIRHGLNRDLDFTPSGRAENIRRVTELAKLTTEAGLITLVSFISPFRAERLAAKQRIGARYFIEIHVDVPLAIAEARDVKGLYKKARAGLINDFTGISSPYEKPLEPELYLDTSVTDADSCADLIINLLKIKKIIF